MRQPLCFEPSIEVDVALLVRPEHGQILHFLAKNLLGKSLGDRGENPGPYSEGSQSAASASASAEPGATSLPE